ncbi:HTH_48 domain-containing protein [Trichonephila clavipes]|nr:HTH_48 domain-containing protein [Trichonephila clavipes]
MVTLDLYSQQLERVQKTLHQKEPALVNRKDVLLLHDSAKPYVEREVNNTIHKLGWEALCHPPYLPDLALSDYPFFIPWTIIFVLNPSPMKQTCANPPEFYCKGIGQLETRRQKLLDVDGDYYED